MIKVSKKLILFCLFFNLFKKSKLECIQDSFDIKTELISVRERNIIVFYRVLTSQADPINYARRCLDSIIITAESTTSKKEENIKIKPEEINTWLNFEFEKLLPLTEFKIRIGYKLVNNDQKFFKTNNDTYTCFSTPGKPENLIADSNAKKSLILKWTNPSVINAPNICYYQIKKRILTESSSVSIQTNQNFYTFSGDDLKKSFEVRISTVNDKKCYSSYPMINKCDTITESDVVMYTYKVTANNNSGSFSKSNILIILTLQFFIQNFYNKI